MHVMHEWRRRGAIGWKKDVPRSLRVGPRYRNRFHEYRKPGRRARSAVAGNTFDLTAFD